MAFPKIICLKQMIILGVDLIDVGQTEKEQEGARENVCIFKLVCVSVCVMERKRKRHEFKGYVWWGTLFSASWTLNDARTGTSISPSDALALLMLSLTNHTLVFLTCLFFFFFIANSMWWCGCLAHMFHETLHILLQHLYTSYLVRWPLKYIFLVQPFSRSSG